MCSVHYLFRSKVTCALCRNAELWERRYTQPRMRNKAARGDNMRIRRAHYENLIAALPRATFHAPRVQRAASASVKRRAAEEVSLCIPMSLDSAPLFALSAKLLFKHTHTLSAVQYALDSQHSSLVLGPLDVGDAKIFFLATC
jgi:hypothetical protein